MKKAFVFRGGWEGHEPVQTTDLVAAALEEKGFETDFSDNLDSLCTTDLEQYDVIIPAWTMGTLPPEAGKALLHAVSGGVGFAGWHGGMCDAFRGDISYHFMTGGQFLAHPGAPNDYRVEIVKSDPVFDGIKDFDIHSEQYYMLVDPGNDVLAVTRFSGSALPRIDGVVMPVVWKRHYGRGRVFYSSLGHNADEFRKYPQILEIMLRGILWAAR